MSLSHKDLNAFIKQYNKEFAIKGYSKLKIVEKNRLVQKRVNEVGGRALQEYNALIGKSPSGPSKKEFEKARKQLKKVTFQPIQREPDDLSRFSFVSRSRGMTIEKALKNAENKGDVYDNLQILNQEKRKKGLKPLSQEKIKEIVNRFKK